MDSEEQGSLWEKQEEDNKKLRRSKDNYLSLLNDERLNTTRLTKQWDDLRSKFSDADQDVYVDNEAGGDDDDPYRSSIDRQADHVFDIPATNNLRRERRGGTRLHSPIAVPRERGRKRNSADVDPGEEESTSESNMRSDGRGTVAVRPSNLVSSTFGPRTHTTAAIPGGPGPSRPTITQNSAGIFTMSVADAKARNFTPSVLPIGALDALRWQIVDWSRRRDDWSRHVNENVRRCVMARLGKWKCLWENGEHDACKNVKFLEDFVLWQ